MIHLIKLLEATPCTWRASHWIEERRHFKKIRTTLMLGLSRAVDRYLHISQLLLPVLFDCLYNNRIIQSGRLLFYIRFYAL